MTRPERHPPPSLATASVTPARFRDVALLLRQTFDHFGVNLDHSPLAKDVRHLEQLASLSEDVWRYAARGPVERRHALEGVVKIVRAQLVANALRTLEAVPGFENVIRHLQGLAFATPGGFATQAWDIYFEAELAAQLVRAGAVLRFDEPDIVLPLDDGSAVGIACKRPRYPDTACSAVRTGLDQIRRTSRHGIVALNVDLVAGHSVRAQDARACRRVLRERLQRTSEALRCCSPAIRWADPADSLGQRGSTAGVLVCASAIAGYPAGDNLHVVFRLVWEARYAVNPAVEDRNRRRALKQMFVWLIDVLRRGHGALTLTPP